MLPQVYKVEICEKGIADHTRGGRGGARCLSPRTYYCIAFIGSLAASC